MRNETDRTDPTAESSRRSFMKRGATTSAALALGFSSAGSAAAQKGDRFRSNGERPYEALLFIDQFHPGSRIKVISPDIEWMPDVQGLAKDSPWSDYEARMIEYENTHEVVPFFPTVASSVGRGEVYQLASEFSFLADHVDETGVVSASFSPVGAGQVEDEEFLF